MTPTSFRPTPSNIDGIRQAILDLGLHKKDLGEILISPKGTLNEWLIDLRRVFLDRDRLLSIAAAFWEAYAERSSFQIAGVESAAIPLLTAIMLSVPPKRASVNAVIVRKERKTYGLGNAVEGVLTQDPVVLVDDILNSGKSAEKALAMITEAGGRVEDMYVVVDYRSAAGMKWRQERKVRVRSLFTPADLGIPPRKPRRTPSQKYRSLWSRQIRGGNPFHVVPKSSPLVVGNRIYRGCDAGVMHCFDAASGDILWEFQTTIGASRKGIWSSPAVRDGRLYFGAYNGVAYCLDAQSGQQIWARSHCEWIGASPVLAAEHHLLYLGLEYERPWAKGSIAALDTRSGNKVWERTTKKYQHGSAAYWKEGGMVLWGTADHDMLGLDAKTGAIKWSFPTGRSVKYAPAVEPGRGLLAFASFDKSIYVLDLRTGEKKGEWETGDICYTTPLFHGNKLFCGSGDRHLYTINLDDMTLLAKHDMRARVYSSPVKLGNHIVFGTSGGRVIEFDTETLEVEGEIQLADAITNAVAVREDNHRLFVSTYMNHLYAFERV